MSEGNCPGCKRYNRPAGYRKCRSCTFGWNSLNGRIDRLWADNPNADPKELIAEEERILSEWRRHIAPDDNETEGA